jgi:DNA-binding XRE family transcriptional regulator
MTLRRFASMGGAFVVAVIAALASYSHMRAVALAYGQSELIADLLPISVDGMMATATAALGDGRRHRWSAWLAFWAGVIASVLANVLAAEPSLVARCISAWPAIAFVLVVEVITRGGPGHTATGRQEPPEPAEATVHPVAVQPARPVQPLAPPAPKQSATRTRRSLAQNRELAAQVRAQHPQITQAELARRLGISATRLRQVDKAEVRPELPRPINHSNETVRSEVSA